MLSRPVRDNLITCVLLTPIKTRAKLIIKHVFQSATRFIPNECSLIDLFFYTCAWSSIEGINDKN